MDLARAIPLRALQRALQYREPYSQGMCTLRLSLLNRLQDAIRIRSFPNVTLICTVDRYKAGYARSTSIHYGHFCGHVGWISNLGKARGLLGDRQ